MKRLVVSVTILASAMMFGSPAHAQQKAPADESPLSIPKVGDTLAPNGGVGWPPKLDWLYDVPSFKDATGKVVLHWFCVAKVSGCADDLARVITLKENAKVYVIAYIDGAKADAKKLDPIRGEEGVGRGTVAFGKHATSLIRRLGVTGPVSVVVGIDNKVAFVSTGQSPGELDARDAKVNALSSAIKDFTSSSDGPRAAVKPGEQFKLSVTIKLSSWLKYSARTPAEFKLTAPADIKCDNTTLRGAQLKVTDQTMLAQVSCSGTKGVYETRGTITFGYDNPVGGGSGLGTDSATWKFEIKP
jgi:hypothetical protein